MRQQFSKFLITSSVCVVVWWESTAIVLPMHMAVWWVTVVIAPQEQETEAPELLLGSQFAAEMGSPVQKWKAWLRTGEEVRDP